MLTESRVMQGSVPNDKPLRVPYSFSEPFIALERPRKVIKKSFAHQYWGSGPFQMVLKSLFTARELGNSFWIDVAIGKIRSSSSNDPQDYPRFIKIPRYWFSKIQDYPRFTKIPRYWFPEIQVYQRFTDISRYWSPKIIQDLSRF